jgi:hypothetical protein
VTMAGEMRQRGFHRPQLADLAFEHFDVKGA